MNRRGFLTRLGGAGAAVVVAGRLGTSAQAKTQTNPDDFTHAGYRVKWRDWTEPPNQNVVFGAWFAQHQTLDLAWASTTLGQCYPTRAWEVLDLARARDWPLITIFSTNDERTAVKARAKAALLTALDEGTLQ